MMTTKARLGVLVIALILFVWTLYNQTYEVSAMVALGMVLLIAGYYRDGTVVLAARAYKAQNYSRAEQLLKEVKNPDRLRKKRRGYYEFLYGNIELKRQNLAEAERHFQIASKFSLGTENDKALVLVQLANLNLAKKDYARVRAYTDKARSLKTTSRVKGIIDKIDIELQKHDGK